MLISKKIKNISFKYGADIVGLAKVSSVKNKNKFLNWLKMGYAGELEYMAKYQAERFNPEQLLPEAKSIISIGVNYYPTEDDLNQMDSPYKIAKYAWGEDYHDVLRNILKKLRRRLKDIIPDLNGRICVDTAPFMDVYWAQMAGLGWQGKNTILISRTHGCYLSLGALIIDVAVDNYDQPHPNHCGNCTACIDLCPTEALVKPYMLDASKCISCWTIESKADNIPDSIEANLNNWIFGCDICLDACPFNLFSKPRTNESLSRRENITLLETGEVIKLSEDKFENLFSKSPVKRPGLKGIKRNILAAKKTGREDSRP